MPTYDYLCESCEHGFEMFQSITAKPAKKCPECGKPKLKRLIGTGAGIIFKGSGFYQTDYRSESYKAAQKKEKEGDKKTDTKSHKKEAKSDSKTAAKDKPKSGGETKPKKTEKK